VRSRSSLPGGVINDQAGPCHGVISLALGKKDLEVVSQSKSRHLVDAELLPLLDAYPTVAIMSENLAEMRRAALVPLPFDYGGDAGAVQMSERSVPGPNRSPAIGLRIYSPNGAAVRGCIFHIHGGGFVSGSAAGLDSLHRSLVAQIQCVLVSVDYRLAPETPFPGAIEDCYAGLTWVMRHASDLGIDPSRVGVTLLARDRNEWSLAFQHLTYPMLDDRTCVSTAPNLFAGEFVWTSHNNAFGWSALLGHAPGMDGVSPYAAPARALDLSGLPPTYLSTGALDLFVDENIEFARRLMSAGVPVELHVYAGAVHGFDLVPLTKIALQARRDSLAALARALTTLRS
jgi:acetyl esterase/lipase